MRCTLAGALRSCACSLRVERLLRQGGAKMEATVEAVDGLTILLRLPDLEQDIEMPYWNDPAPTEDRVFRIQRDDGFDARAMFNEFEGCMDLRLSSELDNESAELPTFAGDRDRGCR